MNWFSRPPNQPYRNLFLAALIGVPVGCLMASLHKALFDATSLQQALKFIAFALPTSVSGYLVMVPLLGAYGLPALWLALKVRLAGPATAFAVSVLPGLLVWLSASQKDTVAWLTLAISAATGVAFVALAYRDARPPQQPQNFEMDSAKRGRVASQTTADKGDRHGKA